MQVALVGPRQVRSGELDGRQQRRSGRLGQQNDYRLASSHSGRQAQVEHRRAARNMNDAASRIATFQPRVRIGMQLDGLSLRADMDSPWLRPVDSRSHHGRPSQICNQLPGQRQRFSAHPVPHRASSGSLR
jgi:hypothetical protein